MAKYKYIHSNIYKRGVCIFIGDVASVRKWVTKFYDPLKEADLISQVMKYCTEEKYDECCVSGTTYYSSRTGHLLIYMPKFDFTYDPVQISNLGHEVLHAIFGILDYVGVEYNYEGSNESYTYFYDYILKEALTEKGYKTIK